MLVNVNQNHNPTPQSTTEASKGSRFSRYILFGCIQLVPAQTGSPRLNLGA